MDIDSRAPAPEGAINWTALNRLGLSPMKHARVEPRPVEAPLQVNSSFEGRRVNRLR